MSFTSSSRPQISKLVCIAAGALRLLHIVEYERRSIPLSRARFVRLRLENPIFPYSLMSARKPHLPVLPT